VIPAISRNYFQTKVDFLYYLYNNLGCNDLRLCYSYPKQDGSVGFSKWVYFRVLASLNDKDIVPGQNITTKEFLVKCSHRTVLDIELMIDIDEKGKFLSIKNHARSICRKLDKANIPYSCHFTGSKSYHISVLFPKFRFMKPSDVKELKSLFLSVVGADTLKSSDNSMIAIEGEPHYRSGKIKKEVSL